MEKRRLNATIWTNPRSTRGAHGATPAGSPRTATRRGQLDIKTVTRSVTEASRTP